MRINASVGHFIAGPALPGDKRLYRRLPSIPASPPSPPPAEGRHARPNLPGQVPEHFVHGAPWSNRSVLVIRPTDLLALGDAGGELFHPFTPDVPGVGIEEGLEEGHLPPGGRLRPERPVCHEAHDVQLRVD